MHTFFAGFTRELTKLGSTALRRRAIYMVEDVVDNVQVHSLVTPGGTPIVQMVTEKTPQGLRIGTSEVNPNFAGMKMGRKLYGQLFDEFKHIRSDSGVSDLAANVYRRLSRIPGAKLNVNPHTRRVYEVPVGEHRKEVGSLISDDASLPVFVLSRST